MEEFKPVSAESTTTYNEVVRSLKTGSKERNQIVNDLERELGANANAVRNAIKDLIDNGYVHLTPPYEGGNRRSAILRLNPNFKLDFVRFVDGELEPFEK